MLKNDFVPVAIDQWYQRRQKDTEGEFYRKVAGQGPRSDFNATTQGRYACSPDGKLLGYNNNRGPERVRAMMKKALEAFNPEGVAFHPITLEQPDPQFLATRVPKDALVIRVTSKVTDGYEKAEDWTRAFQESLGRDNLVFTANETSQLADVIRSGGTIPQKLAKRIARFHLVDNTRGEPEWWRPEEVKKVELTIDSDGQFQGSAHMETTDGKRGYVAALGGIAKANETKIEQFDLVAEGKAWGRGRYTGFEPKGKFSFAVSFRLADGTDPADKIAPHGTKGWGRKYYE